MKRTTSIDRMLLSIIEIASVLTMFVLILFIVYLLSGTLAVQTDSMNLPYQFLSMNNDPVFNILATISGITIGTACLALVLLLLVPIDENTDTGIAIFFALIGMGFAAGLVRMSLSVTIQFFVRLLSWIFINPTAIPR